MTEGTARRTVLNVNDDEAGRSLATRMLRAGGFEVLEAADGAETLRLSREKRPDVVLLDVRLPDIDGYEVCRRLKSDPATSAIAVLHTSAVLVSTEKKVQGLEVGADGYLTQPFEARVLVAMVESLARVRHAEQEARARAERLAEADLRKDEFLAMLAHELRNPLSATTGALALLDRHQPRDDAERRAREVIRRQTSHLGRLVDDLLDVSRVTRGKIELRRDRLQLVPLVLRVAELARERWMRPRQQELVLRLPPGAGPPVEGDATRLEQIFTNLLDNASKYSGAGSSVRLSLDLEGGSARVRVEDDGIGMSREALDHVFSLFFQVDQSAARSRGGLGIGLTLVRTLVELHGGKVRAHSDGLGKGSSFEVELPLAPGGPAHSGDTRPPRPQGTARRVLVVDDHADARETLEDLCALWGHGVSSAGDGVTGVERALAQQPDVALIDIGMPGIDGFEVARRIRRDPRGRAILLVALTGYGAAPQRAQALEAGFDVHMVKPVDPEKLFALLAAPGAPAAARS